MALIGYARAAEQHWKTYRPKAYAKIADPEKFFQKIGRRAEAEVETLTESFLDEARPLSMDSLEREGQINQARARAEEIVLPEWVYPPAETRAASAELPLG